MFVLQQRSTNFQSRRTNDLMQLLFERFPPSSAIELEDPKSDEDQVEVKTGTVLSREMSFWNSRVFSTHDIVFSRYCGDVDRIYVLSWSVVGSESDKNTNL